MKTIVRKGLAVWAMSAGIWGCASDLREAGTDDVQVGSHAGADGTQAAVAKVISVTAEGTTTTTVDSSAEASWVYFSFTKGEVSPSNPAGSTEWDLALQRFKIKSNGGSSGKAGVEVARVAQPTFDALTQAPADGYVVDAVDSADEGSDEDLAFLVGEGWYAYNSTDHTLSPRDVTYVVHTAAGTYYKLQMLGYYDKAGTGGRPSFRWASVTAPAATTQPGTKIEAADAKKWVYWSVASGQVQVSGDPAKSTAWDLAFSRTSIQTNSGTSGAGLGGAIVLSGTDFAAISSTDTIGFEVDKDLPLPGPPGSGTYSGNPVLGAWCDYNPTTHVVSPKASVFAVRTASGTYAKLQVLAYAEGVYHVKLDKLTASAAVHQINLDAADKASWLYWNLSSGTAVSVSSGPTPTDWDVAINRTTWRTNSGTSGVGQGGAADSGSAVLADVKSTSAKFDPDVMSPLPGPPGSGEISANPVLGGWYNYDPATHVVSPKDKVYLLRSANGAVAKFKITSYAAGLYGVDWAFAGPGQTSFP